ncbi:MAG: BamA/TamA family outer membrane protein [Gemmatimonadales bacterium]|nr:BamA/TamA family outer membrane protein [Gemmatimonadales bacterium]MYG49164.1 BamA/TamA family outer membrane protein [Gemmatimonadales bacterium]MYK01798.1 BamA/TamA family outer membrane protein [Candidatus Palauibacter ramosifaciens]
MLRRTHALAALAALAVFSGPAATALEGQAGRYFGRNKVVYESFDFEVLKTQHFDIYYYEESAAGAQMVGRLAERWYARLSRVLNHEFRQRQPIILYADHPDFEQTNTSGQFIDEGTQGFTEILKRRLVMPMMVSIHETDHLLGHELVHAFQFDMTGQGTGGPGLDVPGAIRLPLWFIEGMAEYLSIGPIDPFTTMWMRDALDLEDGFPTIPELSDRRYFPYRYGHAFWSYIGGAFGDDRIGRILNLAARTGNALAAIEAVLEVPIGELSDRWKNELETYFADARQETRSPDDYGRRVVYEPPDEGKLHLGPALSPNGLDMVYVSQSDLFSIEMFGADARTGEVKRRLTNNAVDPHFESLQFIHSAGDWHPDGRLFAVAGIKTGDPLLTIMEAESGNIVREVPVEGFQLGAIFTPSWSPDGSHIAFSGHSAGFTDLYVINVETGQLRRLTEDPFADLQPAWSPDGRSVAFATDRFTTDLELLVPGTYQIALLDLESGEIEPLPGFDDQFRNYNPQWSPDGESLYFVSDHDGIANLYRLDLETRERYLVTDLWTGVSGLTAISPAVSVARATGDVAFSVNKGGPFSYEIYVIDDPDVLAGVPAPEMLVGVDASIIPPRERLSTAHAELLDNARLGLADPITFEDAEFRSPLSLDFISQPTIAFGASDFGVFFAGGAALFFSDLLGNRTLQTILQVNTSFGDLLQGTAALAGYENRSSRWNWAFIGGQVPFVTRQIGFQQIQVGNRHVNIFQDFRWFEINRELTGIVAYPFNRNSRVEFSASARQIDFSGEIEELAFDFFTGQLLANEVTDLEDCAGDPLSFGAEPCAFESLYSVSGSAALVYDSSIFGGTSPIAGQRYRLEVEPAVGTLNFLTVTGDVRRYVRAGPFTVAGRALHFGRWGGGSDDPRLGRLYLGVPSLVRGYDNRSIDVAECTVAGGQVGFRNCPLIGNLIGNRVAVGNVELRLPLLGGIGVVQAPGIPPVEVGLFYDVGKAWSGETPLNCPDGNCSFEDRTWVSSAGFLTRVNLFGLMIAEVNFARPFDRPDKGWIWQFNLTPGF